MASYSSAADWRASTWVRFVTSILLLRQLRRAPSPALEARFALLVEGQHALAPVFGRDHSVVGLDFQHHAVREIHLHAEMDRVLGLPHRDRSVVGNTAAGLDRLLDDAARRAEAVGHAPLGGLGRRERASRPGALLAPPPPA